MSARRGLARYLSASLVLLLLPLFSLSAQDTPEEEEDPWEIDEEFSMSPPFSQPANGGGITFGFGLSGINPANLDSTLGGDLVLNVFELFAVNKGLLVGGSFTTALLFDAPNYDEFSYGYGGLLLGYEHALYYGRLLIRPSVMIGRGGLTMIRTRPDITFDDSLNVAGNEILERVREQDFWMIRPEITIGWSPIQLFRFSASAGFGFATGGDGPVDDLREPIVTFGVTLGSNR